VLGRERSPTTGRDESTRRASSCPVQVLVLLTCRAHEAVDAPAVIREARGRGLQRAAGLAILLVVDAQVLCVFWWDFGGWWWWVDVALMVNVIGLGWGALVSWVNRVNDHTVDPASAAAATKRGIEGTHAGRAHTGGRHAPSP